MIRESYVGIVASEADKQQAEIIMKNNLTSLSLFHPCLYYVLSSLKMVCDETMETMGVMVANTKFYLYYNPTFTIDLVKSKTTNEIRGVLYHEMFHLLLHHCTKRKPTKLNLWQKATDLAVNELVKEIPNVSLPRYSDGSICGTLVDRYQKNPMFSDIQYRQSAEWYYNYLLDKQNSDSAGKESSQDKGNSSSEDVSTGEDESPSLGDSSEDDKSFDDHSGWKQEEYMDLKVHELVKELKNSGKSWGSLPANVQICLEAAQVKRIHWTGILRHFYGNAVTNIREATRKRLNRRTGFLNPGYRKASCGRHLVAVDTSMSIREGLLGQFFGFFNQLMGDFPIDIMQFDREVTQKPQPYDRKTAVFEFKGRGGTSFQPVMDIAKSYESVLIFTDGAAEAVEPPENGAEVVWLLPEGCNPPVSWGKVVHIVDAGMF
jgi:predicted metal-dependent peptidase